MYWPSILRGLVYWQTIVLYYLFSASDAKERQDWINKLRSVAEFHTSSIAQVLVYALHIYVVVINASYHMTQVL